MSKQMKKRFQSGREVLENYIPNYSNIEKLRSPRSDINQPLSGEEYAALILENFEKKLISTNKSNGSL